MEYASEIRSRVEKAIAERVFPGCVIGLIRANKGNEILPFGRLTYEADALEVEKDTMYDMASVTKSIPVASLAAIFIAEGKMRLSDIVKIYIPELQNDYGATIEDLLRYRVQGPQMSKLNYKTFEEIQTHVFERGFAGPPGNAEYSNVPAFLLGIILERAGGVLLPALADRYFFKPLDMIDTTFFPSFAKASEGRPYDIAHIAPTEIVDGQEIRGIVHDESARVFSRARRAVGHAGLFSTAPDMLSFLAAALANDGFTKSIIAAAEQGLGWQLDQEWFMGQHRSSKAFGKTGFIGTSILVDREKKIAFLILSNRCYPQRPPDAASLTSAINIFRKDIADIILK